MELYRKKTFLIFLIVGTLFTNANATTNDNYDSVEINETLLVAGVVLILVAGIGLNRVYREELKGLIVTSISETIVVIGVLIGLLGFGSGLLLGLGGGLLAGLGGLLAGEGEVSQREVAAGVVLGAMLAAVIGFVAGMQGIKIGKNKEELIIKLIPVKNKNFYFFVILGRLAVALIGSVSGFLGGVEGGSLIMDIFFNSTQKGKQ